MSASVSIGEISATLALRDQLSQQAQSALAALGRLDKGLASLGQTLQNAGKKMEDAGATLSLRVTAPLAAVGAVAIKAGAEFERSLNIVAAVSNASAEDMKRLSEAATEWGQKTKFSNTEAAQAMVELAKAGFSVQETIDALPSTLQLATAANLKLDEAASLTANTMRTFGLQTIDLAHSNDILTAAANKSTIDVADLRESLKFIGPVAKVAGVSLSDVASASAVLGGSGIKAEMAGTALRGMLSKLLAPSKDVNVALKALGFEQEVAAGKTVLWTDLLDRLKSKLGESQASADAFTGMIMKGFGQRAGPAILAMAEQGGAAIRQLSDELDKTSGGSAKRMSDAFMKGVPGAIEVLTGALDTAATKLEQALAPAIIKVTGLATKAAEIFADKLVPAFMALPTPIQNTAFAMLGLAAAMGPILLGIGALTRVAGIAVEGFTTIGRGLRLIGGAAAAVAAPFIALKALFMDPTEAVILLANAGSKATAVFGFLEGALDLLVPVVLGVGRVFATVVSPIGLAITAVTAFVYWLIKATDVGPELRRMFSNVWSILKDLAAIVGDVVILAWRTFIDVLGKAWGLVKSTWGSLSGFVGELGDLAKVLINVVPGMSDFKSWLGYLDLAIAAVAFKLRQMRQDLELLLMISGAHISLPTPGPAGPFQPGWTGRALPPPGLPEPRLQAPPGGASMPSVNEQVAESLEKIRKKQADVIIEARAWAQFMGSDFASKPKAMQEEYYEKLRDVVDAHGSLKIMGKGAWDAVYSALDRTVGKTKDATDEFQKAIKSFDPRALPGNVTAGFKAVSDQFESVQKANLRYVIERERMSMSLVDFERRQVARWVEDQKRGFDASLPFVKDYFANVDREAEIAFKSLDIKAKTVLGPGGLNAYLTKNVGNSYLTPPPTSMTAGWTGAVGAISSSFTQLAQVAGDSMNDVTRKVGTAVVALKGMNDAVNEITHAASIAASATGIGGLIAAVFTLAQMIPEHFDKATKAAKKLVEDFGKDVGNSLESQLSAIDASMDRLKAISAGLPAIAGPKPHEAILQVLEALQKQRDELQNQIDELHANEDALKRYGLTLDDLADPLDRARKSITQLGEDLGRFSKMGVGDMAGLTEKLADPLNEALRTALETGQKLPATFAPFLEQLVRGGGLAKDLAYQLLGLPKPEVIPWREMQDAAEEFGIDLANLGPKFQQGRLTEGAEDLAKKWHLLVDNGADVGSVIDGMKGKANEFLHNALKWGLEVPASMRPMLEAMLRAGVLTDENGKKLETLDDVNFGVDITQKFDELIAKIMELIDALIGPDGFQGALNGLKAPAPIVIDVQYRIPKPGEPGGPPAEINNPTPGLDPGNDNTPDDQGDSGGDNGVGGDGRVPQLAEGGVLFKPTRVLAGEAGPEAFIPLSKLRGFGGSQTVNLSVSIDASGAYFPTHRSIQQLADTVALALPDALARRGIRTS